MHKLSREHTRHKTSEDLNGYLQKVRSKKSIVALIVYGASSTSFVKSAYTT